MNFSIEHAKAFLLCQRMGLYINNILQNHLELFFDSKIYLNDF